MLMGMMNIIEYPHNMWNPCVIHCFDFIIEDIERLDWVKEMVTFVTKKPKVLAMYRTVEELDFIEFCNTHFVMMFIVLKWLVKVHKSSKQMVVLNVWSKWNDFGAQKSCIFKNYVLSHDFWKNVQKIVINL